MLTECSNILDYVYERELSLTMITTKPQTCPRWVHGGPEEAAQVWVCGGAREVGTSWYIVIFSGRSKPLGKSWNSFQLFSFASEFYLIESTCIWYFLAPVLPLAGEISILRKQMYLISSSGHTLRWQGNWAVWASNKAEGDACLFFN